MAKTEQHARINLMSQVSKRKGNTYVEATLLAYNEGGRQPTRYLSVRSKMVRSHNMQPSTRCWAVTLTLGLIIQADTEKFYGSAYLGSYKLDHLATSRFCLIAEGDQFEQVDDRLITGGELRYGWQLGQNLNVVVGSDFLRQRAFRQTSIRDCSSSADWPFDRMNTVFQARRVRRG